SFLKELKNNPDLLTEEDQVTEMYYTKAKGVLNLIMRALSESEEIKLTEIENEQELMRLLADIIKDVYTLRTVILRDGKNNNEIQKYIENVINEEKLRKVRNNGGAILSRLFSNAEHIEYVNELKDMSTFQRIDIIELKRKIADHFIKKGREEMKKIGFIGLGNMGFPMVENLLEDGYSVTVYDINKEIVDKAKNLNAHSVDTPNELLNKVDILFTSLPSEKVVEEIYL